MKQSCFQARWSFHPCCKHGLFFGVWRFPGGVFALSVRRGAFTWSQGFFTSTETSNHPVPLLCRADWRECRHRRRPTSLIEKRELLFWAVVQRWSKTPKCSRALIKPRSCQKPPGALIRTEADGRVGVFLKSPSSERTSLHFDSSFTWCFLIWNPRHYRSICAAC